MESQTGQDWGPFGDSAGFFAFVFAAKIVALAQSTELPEAVNAVPYHFELHVRAVTPISATVIGGVLPEGLTLGTSGMISGTPVMPHPQDFNFTVRVKDSSEPPQTLRFDYHIRGFSDSVAAVEFRNRGDMGRSLGFDPATFVQIYEDTKGGGHLIIYDPKSRHRTGGHDTGTHLGVDAESSVVLVPDARLLQNSDLSLNKLFMSAVLSSGDKQQNLEVKGYSEVGKDQSSTDAQRGMAFETTANIQDMVLNMAYTSVDILKYAYGIPEDHPILGGEAQNTIKAADASDKAMVRTRARERLKLYKPEIQAVGDFFTKEQNLPLVRILGKEIFWVDSASLQEIAKQYQENLGIVLDPSSGDTKANDAVDQLLERTKIIVEDFRELLSQVEEAKTSCPETNITGKKYCAEKTVSDRERSRAFQDLAKLFAPGTISLRGAKAADGDLLTLTIEAVGADGSTVGIPAVFEIDVKKYGAKIQWSPSLLFVHRNGVTHKEAFPQVPTPPPPTTPTPINRVNFAPSPGMTFGIAGFKRGNTDWDKFLRAMGPGVGMNVTFMNFNDPSYNLATQQFVNTTGTNVQVGAGFIGSLFDNKLQFSYGWNLNVDRRRNYVAVGFGFIEVGKELTKYIPK